MQKDELRRCLPTIVPAFISQGVSTMARVPRLPVLAPRGGHTLDDTSPSPAPISQPLSRFTSVLRVPVTTPTRGLALDDTVTAIAPALTSQTVTSMDGIPGLPVGPPMGGYTLVRGVSILKIKIVFRFSCLRLL
jgi:hypothetical protein